VYVQPTWIEGYDGAIYFCISNAGLDRGLADDIGTLVRGWIAAAWPFDAVAYPGRGVPWSEWADDPPY